MGFENPLDVFDRYWKHSALRLAKTIQAPILIQTGGSPDQASDEVFNVVQAAGAKSVEVFQKQGSESVRRTILWFNEHLLGGPSLAWKAALPVVLPGDLEELTPVDAAASGEAIERLGAFQAGFLQFNPQF